MLLAQNFGQKTNAFLPAVPRKTGIYRLMFPSFKTKHGIAYGYNISKFEQHRTNTTALRMPHTKNARHRHDIIKL